EMKTKLQDMQLELDILRETIHVLKKDQGVELTPLRNREKAVIIDALEKRHWGRFFFVTSRNRCSVWR
ncbi:MAG: hypothetical protein ACRC76_13415, partial [Proteocatella sp.]